MKIRLALLAVVLLGTSPCLAEPERAPLDRPNVVILFCDDAGYGDFGFTGHSTIRTPHLDRMRREGMAFTQFYSASPACTASRYGLLTGRQPVRSGCGWVVYPKSPRGLHEKEVTIAEALKARGDVIEEIDGRDLAPLLFGQGPREATPFVYGGPGHRTQGIRRGRWKLHVRTNSQTGSDHGWPDVSREKPLLFDLEADPSERFDVASEHPDVVTELLAELDRFEAQVQEEGTFWD